MKLSEQINDLILDYWRYQNPRGASGYLEKSQWEAVLAAVEAMEEGRVLPKLPEGWVYKYICNRLDGTWDVGLTDWRESDYDCFEVAASGLDLLGVVQNAIGKIEELEI